MRGDCTIRAVARPAVAVGNLGVRRRLAPQGQKGLLFRVHFPKVLRGVPYAVLVAIVHQPVFIDGLEASRIHGKARGARAMVAGILRAARLAPAGGAVAVAAVAPAGARVEAVLGVYLGVVPVDYRRRGQPDYLGGRSRAVDAREVHGAGLAAAVVGKGPADFVRGAGLAVDGALHLDCIRPLLGVAVAVEPEEPRHRAWIEAVGDFPFVVAVDKGGVARLGAREGGEGVPRVDWGAPRRKVVLVSRRRRKLHARLQDGLRADPIAGNVAFAGGKHEPCGHVHEDLVVVGVFCELRRGLSRVVGSGEEYILRNGALVALGAEGVCDVVVGLGGGPAYHHVFMVHIPALVHGMLVVEAPDLDVVADLYLHDQLVRSAAERHVVAVGVAVLPRGVGLEGIRAAHDLESVGDAVAVGIPVDGIGAEPVFDEVFHAVAVGIRRVGPVALAVRVEERGYGLGIDLLGLRDVARPEAVALARRAHHVRGIPEVVFIAVGEIVAVGIDLRRVGRVFRRPDALLEDNLEFCRLVGVCVARLDFGAERRDRVRYSRVPVGLDGLEIALEGAALGVAQVHVGDALDVEAAVVAADFICRVERHRHRRPGVAGTRKRDCGGRRGGEKVSVFVEVRDIGKIVACQCGRRLVVYAQAVLGNEAVGYAVLVDVAHVVAGTELVGEYRLEHDLGIGLALKQLGRQRNQRSGVKADLDFLGSDGIVQKAVGKAGGLALSRRILQPCVEEGVERLAGRLVRLRDVRVIRGRRGGISGGVNRKVPAAVKGTVVFRACSLVAKAPDAPSVLGAAVVCRNEARYACQALGIDMACGDAVRLRVADGVRALETCRRPLRNERQRLGRLDVVIPDELYVVEDAAVLVLDSHLHDLRAGRRESRRPRPARAGGSRDVGRVVAAAATDGDGDAALDVCIDIGEVPCYGLFDGSKRNIVGRARQWVEVGISRLRRIVLDEEVAIYADVVVGTCLARHVGIWLGVDDLALDGEARMLAGKLRAVKLGYVNGLRKHSIQQDNVRVVAVPVGAGVDARRIRHELEEAGVVGSVVARRHNGELDFERHVDRVHRDVDVNGGLPAKVHALALEYLAAPARRSYRDGRLAYNIDREHELLVNLAVSVFAVHVLVHEIDLYRGSAGL